MEQAVIQFNLENPAQLPLPTRRPPKEVNGHRIILKRAGESFFGRWQVGEFQACNGGLGLQWVRIGNSDQAWEGRDPGPGGLDTAGG